MLHPCAAEYNDDGEARRPMFHNSRNEAAAKAPIEHKISLAPETLVQNYLARAPDGDRISSAQLNAAVTVGNPTVLVRTSNA
jgi:hypothetical protein